MWYNVKIHNNNNLIIKYSSFNRFIALFSLSFMSFLIIFYCFILNSKPKFIPFIIYISIMLFLFIMSFLTDKIVISKSNNFIKIYRGLIFIYEKVIPLNEVSNIYMTSAQKKLKYFFVKEIKENIENKYNFIYGLIIELNNKENIIINGFDYKSAETISNYCFNKKLFS